MSNQFLVIALVIVTALYLLLLNNKKSLDTIPDFSVDKGTTATTAALTAAQVLNGVFFQNSAAVTLSTPTAASIVTLAGTNDVKIVGQTFTLILFNRTGAAGAITLAAGTGVTIPAGPTTVAAGNGIVLKFKLDNVKTGSEAVSVTIENTVTGY